MDREVLRAMLAGAIATLQEVRDGAEIVNGATRLSDRQIEELLCEVSLALEVAANGDQEE